MSYFALKRTNGNNEHKFKGVETASQVRFVKYFEKIINEMDLELPPVKSVVLDRILIHSINGLFFQKKILYITKQNFLIKLKILDLGNDWEIRIYSNDKETKTILDESNCEVLILFSVIINFKICL